MTFTQIIVPAAGLQVFEPTELATHPLDTLLLWKEEAGGRIELHDDALCMPFEMAYARALEIRSDEGLMPWAAYETHTLSQPCAWVHPCRLEVGMTDMVMQPVDRLRLTDSESRELHALIAPYFEQDGIRLNYHSATRWLALGPQFSDFECASLARVQGRSINAFLPGPGDDPQQLKISRLQAEVQMLLYTHPLSEARTARGLPAVNSFWIDGAGILEAWSAPSGSVRLEFKLQEAQHSESAYANAWRSLLAQWHHDSEQALAQGRSFGITLCGERSALTLWVEKPHWTDKILSFLGRSPAKNLRGML